MRRWLVLVSATLHITLVLGLFVAGFWHLEQLDRPKLSVALVQPVSPPAPSGGAPHLKAPTLTHKPIVHHIVSPEPRPIETAKPIATETPGNGSGEGSGQGSGDPKSTSDCLEDCGSGAGSGSAKRPPIIIQHHEVAVPPAVIRGLRLSGETQIHPSELDQTAMMRDGKDRVIAMFKTCVSAAGAVDLVAMLKTTGYPGYDQLLADGLRAWRYKPYEIGGERVRACGIVTFVYQIK